MFEELLHRRKLPDRLVFPPAVHQQFALLWRRSVESHMEWGMTLCMDEAGRLHCRHAHAGTLDGFSPDLRVRRGERLFGTYHTHVYWGGETGIAFSDLDFAEFVARAEIPVSVAQSGDELFALVQTLQTATVAPTGLVGGNGCFYAKVADAQEADTTVSYQRALWLTNLYFGRVSGCALYRGRLFQPLKGVFRP